MREPTPSLVPWSASTDTGTALVCVPWAGAGAGPFRSWGRVVTTAAVHGVRIAGRENRRHEPAPATLCGLAAGLAAELAALPWPRVALFGHCSGALVAFETARALRGLDRAPELTALIVASQLPPADVAGDSVDIDRDQDRYVPDELREEPELVELLRPVVAADMRLVAGYRYAPAAPLTVPLTVLYGSADGRLDRAAVDGWRHETTAATDVREIAGAGHLFGGAAWHSLAETVAAAVRPPASQAHGPDRA
ncbi:thioesterase [Catellatospora methionotrophica]|uniref:Thioesterase n=1 Tax=Catellatospora methionotrophica TaxID=121620 RepID=A0A8J3LCQ7_9ACTN|nr:thioesterase [Catellatospora methionotrophica]GIG16702.1 thioesterase [Catellatospora methionotrophica]